MRREIVRAPKQIERPTTIMLRQDEQEHWLQTVVGLAANRQVVRWSVRRGARRGGICVHTERSKYLLTFSSSSLETMTPRSCEYCFGSISWDARLALASSFRVGGLQYKRVRLVSRSDKLPSLLEFGSFVFSLTSRGTPSRIQGSRGRTYPSWRRTAGHSQPPVEAKQQGCE
jgi:hypothetical protein